MPPADPILHRRIVSAIDMMLHAGIDPDRAPQQHQEYDPHLAVRGAELGR
jgi:hypothetical protein